MEVTEENAPGISNSGRVDMEHIKNDIFRIRKFHPKGKGHIPLRSEKELRTCGIGIFGPHIFECIDRLRPTITGGEFTDLPVRNLILKERGMLGCLLPGTVFDIGNPKGYEQCLHYNQRISDSKP
jgi:UTP-glucose-1-phosphate uridylyltransferase